MFVNIVYREVSLYRDGAEDYYDVEIMEVFYEEREAWKYIEKLYYSIDHFNKWHKTEKVIILNKKTAVPLSGITIIDSIGEHMSFWIKKKEVK